MEFSMMAVDDNRLFDACKRFLIMDLESIEKMHELDWSEDCIKEAMNIFFNHASNLYVCGMIDEEFFRGLMDDIVVNGAIDDLLACMNDIRKDIVKCTG